jgi:hypothetical protein
MQKAYDDWQKDGSLRVLSFKKKTEAYRMVKLMK